MLQPKLFFYLMKWSNYNIIHAIDSSKSAIYNYAWDSAIVLFNELLSIIKNNLHDIDELSDIHNQLYNDLVKKHIIIDDNIDEAIEIINKIKTELNSQKCLDITINPTMDCNLKCWYCYESHIKNSVINEQTFSDLVKFIEKQCTNTDLKVLNLSFFGGEPLMKAKSVVIPLVQKIDRICKHSNKQLNLRFVSNGVLLSQSVVNALYDISKDTFFQIAFDGDRDYHNNTKKNLNETGTYDIVLNNINYALSKHLNFNIRCNYTLDNVLSFKGLIADLKNLPNFNPSLIGISFQRVWQEADTQILESYIEDVKQYAIDCGFYSMIAKNIMADSFCYADKTNSFVFNYNGDVFKCTARKFDSKKRIGFLTTDGDIQFENGFVNIPQIGIYTECKGCKILPLCTICRQEHEENKINHCPRNISLEDMNNQILQRFKILYKDVL